MSAMTDYAWAAGLFEGEGTIYLAKKKSGNSPMLSLSSTDRDVVRRFHRILGVGRIDGPYQVGENKPYWMWCVSSYAKVQWIVILFWRWLGKRRKNRAREILVSLHGTVVPPSQRERCPQGHPYSPENTLTIIRRSGPREGRSHRVCRTCAQEKQGQYRRSNLPRLARYKREYRKRRNAL